MEQKRKLEIGTSIVGILGLFASLAAILIKFGEITPDFWAIATLVIAVTLMALAIIQLIGNLLDQEFLKVIGKIVEIFS